MNLAVHASKINEASKKRIYLVALAIIFLVLRSRMSQSRRMPFFPDDATQVSISTTSPLWSEIVSDIFIDDFITE
jgi:hypothetical protein